MTAPRTVLITGAAGFVGRSLARGLHAAGWRVTGLDRVAVSGEDARAFAAFTECDLLDDAALAPRMAGQEHDAIVHLAGLLPAHGGRAQLFAVNAGGTSALVEHVARPGCHVVLFSTGLVYGPQKGPFREDMPGMPTDGYAQSKLAAEVIATSWGRATRSPIAVLRPSVLYGPGAPAGMLLMSLFASLRKGLPFAMTRGEQLRDFLHIDDVTRAVVRLLEQRADGTWNLSSGRSVTVRDAATMGANIAGRPELLQPGALPYRDNEVFDYRLDPSKLRATCGWEPRVDLAGGLEGLWRATA